MLMENIEDTANKNNVTVNILSIIGKLRSILILVFWIGNNRVVLGYY